LVPLEPIVEKVGRASPMRTKKVKQVNPQGLFVRCRRPFSLEKVLLRRVLDLN